MPLSQPATLPVTTPNGAPESLLGRVADEFLRRLEAGERPKVEAYVERYPEHADTLRRMLGALLLLEHSADGSMTGSLQPAPLTGVLGDFRVLNEIGRGGMGIVYEAEQISLGRRVALKILPFASILDPRQLTRFQNEARATATLNHPHIVPVYTTGVERGVHYLAMRLIDGESLARYGVRQEDGETGRRGEGEKECDSARLPLSQSPPLPLVSTLRAAAITTHAGGDERQWYRRVAQWGVEAAEALEHAHSLGIVHRDVKPGNLLVDGDGKLWVTDFGLARLPTDAGLTMTGDMLGTLRYMSPEQALARHGLVDHRTDIYSLGATLYELLTGQPVVLGRDREQILKALSQSESIPLRKYAAAVPVDLETVVLKAIARDAVERYYSAKELADDLRRVITGDPVRARRPTIGKRTWHWLRRNARLAMAVSVVMLLALIVGAAYAMQRYTQHATTIALVREAQKESLRFQDKFEWQDALASAKRASALANTGVIDRANREFAELREVDLETALALDDVRIDLATNWEQPGFREQADANYARLFAKLGVTDIDGTPAQQTLEQLRRRTIVSQLAISLDSWAAQIGGLPEAETRVARRHALAEQIDPDPLRNRLRSALRQPKAEHAKLLLSIARDKRVAEYAAGHDVVAG